MIQTIPPTEPRCTPVTRHRLSELPTGATGVVHHYEHADAAAQRLMAMGLCVGRHVAVIRQGNPLIVRVLGARVGISGRVAQHIVIEPKAN